MKAPLHPDQSNRPLAGGASDNRCSSIWITAELLESEREGVDLCALRIEAGSVSRLPGPSLIRACPCALGRVMSRLFEIAVVVAVVLPP